MRNRFLFIARHAAHSEGRITDEGRLQMTRLAERIQPHVSMRKQSADCVVYLASKAALVVASALSLAHGANIVLADCLEAEERVPLPQLTEAREFIEFYCRHFGVVVVITHKVMTKELPRHLAEYYHLRHQLPDQPLPHGRAILFDADKITCELLPE